MGNAASTTNNNIEKTDLENNSSFPAKTASENPDADNGLDITSGEELSHRSNTEHSEEDVLQEERDDSPVSIKSDQNKIKDVLQEERGGSPVTIKSDQNKIKNVLQEERGDSPVTIKSDQNKIKNVLQEERGDSPVTIKSDQNKIKDVITEESTSQNSTNSTNLLTEDSIVLEKRSECGDFVEEDNATHGETSIDAKTNACEHEHVHNIDPQPNDDMLPGGSVGVDDTTIMHCFLCMKKFKDPRLLPCYHSYCYSCLDDYILSKHNEGTVKCPLCYVPVQIPETGTKGFMKNIYFHDDIKFRCDACKEDEVGEVMCEECENILCYRCSSIHSKMTEFLNHHISTINNNDGPKQRSCRVHLGKDLFLYCRNCNEAICEVCNITTHKLHDTQDIESMGREIRTKLNHTISKYDEPTFVPNAVSCFENNTLNEIQKHEHTLYNLVHEVKCQLQAQIMTLANQNNSDLNCDDLELARLKASAESQFMYGKVFLQKGNDFDMASTGLSLNNCLLESTKEQLQLHEEKSSTFVPYNVTLSDVARLFGQVYPNRQTPGDSATDSAEVATSEVYPIKNIAKIKTEATQNSGTENMKTFKIVRSFSCSVEGCMVTGLCPLENDTLFVCLGNEKILEHFNTNGTLLSSTNIGQTLDGVIMDKQGTVFISSNSGKKIISINNQGKAKTFIRTKLCPRGMALSEDGICMVGLVEKDTFFDSENNTNGCVSSITPEGETKTCLRGCNVQYPARIAINKDNTIVISDWIQMAVFIFKNDEEVGCYKGNCDVSEDFIPRGICCTSDGDIIVVDIAINSLHLLSSVGTFKRVLAEIKDLEDPWSIAVDGNDNLWIGTNTGEIHFATIIEHPIEF